MGILISYQKLTDTTVNCKEILVILICWSAISLKFDLYRLTTHPGNIMFKLNTYFFIMSYF